jgi:HD-GYP domain-containing protein (c-di-GMP phosphodiesterase class II)
MQRLHTVAGYEELVLRESTRVFADVALGHHGWYQGEGYPKDYVRNQSPYRQMTDVTAVVAYLIDHCHGEPEQTIQAVIRQEGKRFSPMVTAFLNNEALRRDLIDLLTRDDDPLFQELYEAITA